MIYKNFIFNYFLHLILFKWQFENCSNSHECLTNGDLPISSLSFNNDKEYFFKYKENDCLIYYYDNGIKKIYYQITYDSKNDSYYLDGEKTYELKFTNANNRFILSVFIIEEDCSGNSTKELYSRIICGDSIDGIIIFYYGNNWFFNDKYISKEFTTKIHYFNNKVTYEILETEQKQTIIKLKYD